MVQRKQVPNKIGIKPHHHKLDTQFVNHKPSSSSSSSSSQSHEKMKKIMKKSRTIKLGSSPTPATPPKQSPNYMKSTSSFEARKEQSPVKTPTPKVSKNSKTNESASSAVKGTKTSSLKMVRSLTKTPSFKPLRSSKKVIMCEDVDAKRPTCSSTLKESKFPDYLQLDHGGTELDGTSAMKVCPYTYCSLNGHRHAPVPPLKCFLSARRRALKSQKGFKLGCLSPRQIKVNVKKSDDKERVILNPEEVDMKEENKDLFYDNIKGDQDLECSDIDWEEGYCSGYSVNDDFKLWEIDGGVADDQTGKTTSVEHQELVNDDFKLQEIDGGGADDQTGKKMIVESLYDEESVSSGAWSEEDGDSASDSSFEVSSTASESDINEKIDEFEALNLPPINYQKEETSQDSKTGTDFEEVKDETDKNRTTIIYNIIQFNISVFVNGEKTEDSEMDKTVTVQAPETSVSTDKMEAEEAVEEKSMSNEDDEASEVNQMVADEHVASTFEKQEYEACSQTNSMGEEPAAGSDVDQTHGRNEITSETDIKTNSFCEKSGSNAELPDPCMNLKDLTRSKRPEQEIGDDLWEFNPRGPNFLPETPDPDAETVDLRHQMMDDRKNAEEWMVDFALQQAVTTLAPARKRKVALLVEAFEKVMPAPAPAPVPVRVPMYETHNRHVTKPFTNSRPMQACS